MLSENESPVEATPAKPYWRWAVLAIVAVILIYPAVRRLNVHGKAPAMSPASAAIASSFQAYNAGQFEQAIAYAKVALQTDPNSADAYNNIAASYAGLKNWDLAIQSIQQALRLRPDYQLAKNNLAWYLQQKAGAPAPASPPATADFYVNLSLQLYQAGKYRECIITAREALKRNPQSAAAYNNIAAASSAMKMWDQAIAAAQQAVRIDPGLQIAKNNLAWAVQQKRR